MKTTKRYPAGSALLASVLVLTTVLIIGLGGLLRWASTGYRGAVNRTKRTRMLFAAESGLQYAMAAFESLPPSEVHPTDEDYTYVTNSYITYALTNFPPDIRLVSYVVASNRTYYGPIREGRYEGYQAYVMEMKVQSSVCDKNDTNNVVTLEQMLQSVFISIFQFGIFYGHDDVEFHNGPAMDFTGPVHCNKNMFFWPISTLSFHTSTNAHATAAESFLHCSKGDPSYRRYGPIRFKDSDNAWEYMEKDGVWLDSSNSFWEIGALQRWDGYVRDEAHGVKRLDIPIPGAETNTHLIVEPPQTNDTESVGLVRYANKAALVISGETLYAQSGDFTNTTRSYVTHITNLTWIVTTNQFINKRQGYMIHPLDIDVAEFGTWLTNPAAAGFISSSSPRAGVMYVQMDNVDGNAVRVHNGSMLPMSLPAGLGMTVATERPIYLQGDYNIVSNRPSGLICDAFTMLSSAWRDDMNQTYNKNRANPTTAYAAVMTGHTPTIIGQSGSGGGVHNLPRFLENWSDKNFVFIGSLVCTWDSIYEYRYMSELLPYSQYYSPPRRIWSYDTKFSTPDGTPAGTPNIHAFEATRWNKVN